jgi:hypothetical protein
MNNTHDNKVVIACEFHEVNNTQDLFDEKYDEKIRALIDNLLCLQTLRVEKNDFFNDDSLLNFNIKKFDMNTFDAIEELNKTLEVFKQELFS